MLDLLIGPTLQQDFLDLLETFLRAVRVDLVSAIFVQIHQAAATEADDQAAFAQIVDQ
jgi:hypothetical protein